jgi:hypothetical protein
LLFFSGGKMKNVYKALPFLLLIASLAVSLTSSEPTIAHSIIVGVLSALCGYSLYIIHTETPDIRKEVAEALRQRDEEIIALKNRVGSYDIAKKASSAAAVRF